jgi:hypothetical protein
MKISLKRSQKSLEKKFMGTHCNALLVKAKRVSSYGCNKKRNKGKSTKNFLPSNSMQGRKINLLQRPVMSFSLLIFSHGRLYFQNGISYQIL